MFEYLASAQASVNRINYRMQTIANNLGKDSPYYQNMLAKMDILFPDNIRYKDGVAGLSKPSELFKNPESNQNLQNFDKELKTWGEIKKQYEEPYERYKEEQEFFGNGKEVDTFQGFINLVMDIPRALSYLYPTQTDDQKKAVEIMKTKGRRKTYDELQEVVTLAGKSANTKPTIDSFANYWQPRE